MAASQHVRPSGVTELLCAWHDGDDSALDSLIPLVYNELRRIAAHYMRRERLEHTLEVCDLVHVAFLGLPKLKGIEWQNRTHFYAMSATLMRRALANHAKRRARRISAESEMEPGDQGDETGLLLAVNGAVEELARYDSELACIVEMKFFGGRNVAQIAEATGLSEATVKRRWKTAKGWLHKTILDVSR